MSKRQPDNTEKISVLKSIHKVQEFKEKDKLPKMIALEHKDDMQNRMWHFFWGGQKSMKTALSTCYNSTRYRETMTVSNFWYQLPMILPLE